MSFCIENLKHTYVVAEMSANHGGSLDRVKKIVRAAKEARAD